MHVSLTCSASCTTSGLLKSIAGTYFHPLMLELEGAPKRKTDTTFNTGRSPKQTHGLADGGTPHPAICFHGDQWSLVPIDRLFPLELGADQQHGQA
jgi:hypothetical protein